MDTKLILWNKGKKLINTWISTWKRSQDWDEKNIGNVTHCPHHILFGPILTCKSILSERLIILIYFLKLFWSFKNITLYSTFSFKNENVSNICSLIQYSQRMKFTCNKFLLYFIGVFVFISSFLTRPRSTGWFFAYKP